MSGTPALSPGSCMLRPGSGGRSEHSQIIAGTESCGMGKEKAEQHCSGSSFQETFSLLLPRSKCCGHRTCLNILRSCLIIFNIDTVLPDKACSPSITVATLSHASHLFYTVAVKCLPVMDVKQKKKSGFSTGAC